MTQFELKSFRTLPFLAEGLMYTCTFYIKSQCVRGLPVKFWSRWLACATRVPNQTLVLGSFEAARAAEMKSFPLKQPKLGNFLLYFCECARYVSEMASKNHFHNVVWLVWFGPVRFGFVWLGTVWYGLVLYGLVWFCIV